MQRASVDSCAIAWRHSNDHEGVPCTNKIGRPVP
jgi:hypothetical protein